MVFWVLKDLESITKALQSDSTTLADVRALFDKVSEEYPQLQERLADDFPIVHDVTFERAVVKLQLMRQIELSQTEKYAVSSIMNTCTNRVEGVPPDTNLLLAERALKKRRIEERTGLHGDSLFLFPTSNAWERMF